MTRSRRSRRANSAIEFAMVLPVFLSIGAGIVEYGNFFQQEVDLTQIVREAGREAILRPQHESPGPVEAAQTRIQDALKEKGYTGQAAIRATIDGTAPDQLLVVSASLPYDPLLGMIPSPGHVSAQVVLRLYDQE